MSRASSKESSAVLEENLPSGVPDPEAAGAGGELGVSGDNPGTDKAKMDQETTGEEAKEAATAVCSTVTLDLSVSMAPTPVNTQVKWSAEGADKYLQSLGLSLEGQAEVS